MSAEGDPAPRAQIPQSTVHALCTDLRLGQVLVPLTPSAERTRPLLHPRVQKNGLVLAGHFHGMVPTRVQVFGDTEFSYLAAQDAEERDAALDAFFARSLSCVLVTGVAAPSAADADSDRERTWRALIAAAERTQTALSFSPLRSSVTINLVHAVLDDLLAPHLELHGVLVDVYGVGMLLRGNGGIGKSECALELVQQGHRLVADDVVCCDYRPPGAVFGMPAPLLRHHMEIRGLGILNIREQFGVTSVRERKRIDVVVRLVEWRPEEEYDRLGIEDSHETILGVPIRALTVPVRPGRNMGTILEIAARDELLRKAGIFSARRFVSRVERGIHDDVVDPGLRRRSADGERSPMTSAIPAPPESSMAELRRRSDMPKEGA